MQKRLIILGCGDTLNSDVKRVGIRGDVMVTNQLVFDYPGRIDHVSMLDYSVDGDKYILKRKNAGYNMNFSVHKRAPQILIGKTIVTYGKSIKAVTNHGQPLFMWYFTNKPIRNSGLFGALVGKALGYDEIVMLGCPGSGGHYYDLNYPLAGPPTEAMDIIKDHPEFFSGVRSASGLTAELLGGVA